MINSSQPPQFVPAPRPSTWTEDVILRVGSTFVVTTIDVVPAAGEPGTLAEQLGRVHAWTPPADDVEGHSVLPFPTINRTESLT